MREKLAIARKLRISRKNFSDKTEDQILCLKCYYTYVLECIIKGKDKFEISFNGKYVKNFLERALDWFNYVLDSIYRFFLVHFTPNNDKTFKRYELIHYGVSKPIHVKVTNAPNETVLYSFLEENGFQIIEEHLYNVSTVYDVARI